MSPKKQVHTSKKGPLNRVRHVLEKADLVPEPIPEGNGYVIRFSDGPPVRGIALVYDDESRFVFYLEFLKNVPPKARPEVAEYIARANFGITMGNFEMDYDSGVIRFKTSVDYAGAELEEAFVRNAVLAGMDAVELYANGLTAVVQGKRKPSEAIREVEGNFKPQ